MDEYDIRKTLIRIEDEMIRSMMRNFKRHRAEEEKEGYNWTMWQVEQIRALEEYKRRNLKAYKRLFGHINADIDKLIIEARKSGNATQEEEILNAIRKGLKLNKANKDRITGEFFKTNDRKFTALIKATKHDMEKAEHAILRRANDQYRKIIFQAQVYANTGAGTYEKAVDMATHDFLNAGIQCVQYKNGSMHKLSDYASMAIRTASKRAYLMGEAEKREEWGIHTVIINKRGNACPLCMPFVGKIMIDDVWGNGTRKDGPYPLLSSAVKAGLYHPNCRDVHTTYFPGISSERAEYTEEEKQQVVDRYNAEQKENYAKRQAEKFGRLAEYSLDEENRRGYEARVREWKERANKLGIKFDLNNQFENGENTHYIKTKLKDVNKRADKMGLYDFAKNVNPVVANNILDEVEKAREEFGEFKLSSITAIIDNVNYDGIFENGRIGLKNIVGDNAMSKLKDKAQKMKKAGKWTTASEMHTCRHEIGHAILEDIKLNDPNWELKEKRLNDIIKEIKLKASNEIEEAAKYYKNIISRYAIDDVDEFVAESIAEYLNSSKKCRTTAKSVVEILKG